jgi:hypothetical protein
MRRVVLASLAMALLACFARKATAQEEIQAIVNKAVKAHGGAEKLNKLKCVQSKSKGKLELLGGVDFTQEVTAKYSGKFKEVLEMEIMGNKVTVTTAFDGTKGWISANGKLMDANDKILEELKEASYGMKVARLANILNDKSLRLSALGESKVEARPAVGVKIASEGHRDIDLYFDKESGLLVKVEARKHDFQTMQEVTEERIITEYQEVDGQKTAKKVLVNRDGKKFMEVEVNDVKFLDEIDDREFKKP